MRQFERAKELRPEELASLAEAYAALMAEYPDVYADAPVPLEKLQASLQDFRESEGALKDANLQVKQTSKKLKEALKTRDEMMTKLRSMEGPLKELIDNAEAEAAAAASNWRARG